MNAKMAASERLAHFRERLRQPGAILLAALAAAVAVLALLIWYTIFPALKEEAEIRFKHAELERKLKELERTPLPERVDPAAVLKLAQRVPLTEEMPEFLASLQMLERTSGAVITMLTAEEETQEETDPETDLLAKLQNGGDLASDEEDAGANSEEKMRKITPIRLNMTVQGSYEQVLAMMGGLQSLERIVAIQSWNMEPEPDSDSGEAAGYLPVQLTMSISIFQADGYKSSFPDVPQPESPDSERKERNPMAGERLFADMLRQSAIQ